MHHKYVVRDAAAVWTGSANWTLDSWSRQENVLAIVDSSGVAERFKRNFEELWEDQDVEKSGLAQAPEIANLLRIGGTRAGLKMENVRSGAR